MPQEEQSWETKSQFSWKTHLCLSIILLTFCWDVSENLPTAHWISEVFKSATVGNAEVEALA